jgi:hypothetical protein
VKHIALSLFALFLAVAPSALSQTTPNDANTSTSHSVQASPSSYFFPRNWIRGYTDFAVAPSHNEPDLGRCMFPQPASAGGTASQCTAYARYLMSGYLEIQPLARTPLRHLFLFFEPRFSFGRNIPQLSYQASMEPMAYDRALGAAFELPRNVQLRVTQHQVDYLGRYGSSLGSADLHTTGPYGLYTTVSVRWSFGGYGRNGAPAVY